MKDKFRENFWIAFPAALVTLVLILILSLRTTLNGAVAHDTICFRLFHMYSFWQEELSALMYLLCFWQASFRELLSCLQPDRQR